MQHSKTTFELAIGLHHHHHHHCSCVGKVEIVCPLERGQGAQAE